MDLLKIHTWLNFVVDKETSGWFSHEELDSALDRAQMEQFNKKKLLYAVDQKAQDDLGPFKVTKEFTNSDTENGVLTFPETYQHLTGLYKQSYDNDNGVQYEEVKVYNDDEIARRLSSQVRKVTNSKPIAQWYGKGQVQLWPKEPNAGVAYYLRRPIEPKFVYTMNGREVVYNQASSTQMEWDDTNINEIMIRSLEYLGINLDQDKLTQYALSK
jgi:hypothetical protein